MLSNLFESVPQHIWIATASIIALLAIIFMVWSRYTNSLWGKDFWVTLPIVGRMSGWKSVAAGAADHDLRVSAGAGYVERTLVMPAERALYDYYDDCMEKTSRAAFINAREYLKISGQSGRKPMSALLWIILGAWTLAGAFGIAPLLAPLLSTNVTPELALISAAATAFVTAIVALLIGRGAGEDWFANTLLAKARNGLEQSQGIRRSDDNKAGDFVREVGPQDDQERDANLEPNGRLAARIGATSMASMKPRRLRIIAAVVLILVLAINVAAYGHYAFRHANGAFDQGSSAASNAGIMILTLIYVFTPLFGFLTGAKYSFFDRNAQLAYQRTHGQLGYDDFLRVAIRPVAQRAQMRLGQLRAKLLSAHPGYGDHMKSFDFMQAYHESLAEYERTAQRAPAAGQTESPAPDVTRGASAAADSVIPSTGPDPEGLARPVVELKDSAQR